MLICCKDVRTSCMSTCARQQRISDGALVTVARRYLSSTLPINSVTMTTFVHANECRNKSQCVARSCSTCTEKH